MEKPNTLPAPIADPLCQPNMPPSMSAAIDAQRVTR
jgi:hypothetical protein